MGRGGCPVNSGSNDPSPRPTGLDEWRGGRDSRPVMALLDGCEETTTPLRWLAGGERPRRARGHQEDRRRRRGEGQHSSHSSFRYSSGMPVNPQAWSLILRKRRFGGADLPKPAALVTL